MQYQKSVALKVFVGFWKGQGAGGIPVELRPFARLAKAMSKILDGTNRITDWQNDSIVFLNAYPVCRQSVGPY